MCGITNGSSLISPLPCAHCVWKPGPGPGAGASSRSGPLHLDLEGYAYSFPFVPLPFHFLPRLQSHTHHDTTFATTHTTHDTRHTTHDTHNRTWNPVASGFGAAVRPHARFRARPRRPPGTRAFLREEKREEQCESSRSTFLWGLGWDTAAAGHVHQTTTRGAGLPTARRRRDDPLPLRRRSRSLPRYAPSTTRHMTHDTRHTTLAVT